MDSRLGRITPTPLSVAARSCVLLLIALAGGCDDRADKAALEAPAEPATAAPVYDYAALQARSERTFPRAVLILPDDARRDSAGFWMSPLILAETREEESDDFSRFYALATDHRAEREVDQSTAPTVYFYQSETAIDGVAYEQTIHLWFYPAANDGEPAPFLGVRQILDKSGYGVLWESLSSEARDREFYVAESLEEAAAAQFGEPLADRRFSIEPVLADHPEVVVIRTVGEGPQPMGPYVYVDWSSPSISTLRCRCEPAQITQYGSTLHYALKTIERPDQIAVIADLEEADLNGRLRWPAAVNTD